MSGQRLIKVNDDVHLVVAAEVEVIEMLVVETIVVVVAVAAAAQ